MRARTELVVVTGWQASNARVVVLFAKALLGVLICLTAISTTPASAISNRSGIRLIDQLFGIPKLHS